MSGGEFRQLVQRLVRARTGVPAAAFAALPVPAAGGHMAALSPQGRPSLLVRTANGGTRPRDITLSGLKAMFGVTCMVAVGDSAPEERRISIIECTAADDALPLFTESAGAFLRLLGPSPTMAEAATGVARFAALFSSLTMPARQGVTGLVGELMLLLLASNAAAAVRCWRASPTDRFDFNSGDARVECKASSAGLRLHSFSWEQCNPPEGPALAASLLVEQAGGGTSVRTLLDRIEDRLAASPEAAARLRETVATTMGSSLVRALETCFDEPACRASLRWFELRDVPAIRGDLPPGVGGLRFTSDLSFAQPVSPSSLRETALECLVPSA